MKQITMILIITLLMITACNQQTQICIDIICFEETCYELEIPKTQEEFTRGLMHREYLPENQGMLFIFPDSQKYGFWMKNTTIPLDMIWLNEDLEIVYLEHAEPCKEELCTIYAPDTDALYVLEINQNQTTKNNIQKGSKANLNICI